VSETSINASEKTGMPPEPFLLGYSANMPAANKASEAVRQDENKVTGDGQGDSEEERLCTQPARSTPVEDAELLILMRHQAGPEPRESHKLSCTKLSQERQGQSNTGGEGDTTEEPMSAVQIASPSGATNGSSAMLKRDGSGEGIERQEGEPVDAFVDAIRSKTPPLVGSVHDCATQPSVPASAPLEPSSCDRKILQDSALGVDTFQLAQSGGRAPPRRSTRPTTVSSTEASKRPASMKASKRPASMKVSGDPAPLYIEEQAYLFHDPSTLAVSADNLPPLPAAPPLVIPTTTECKWAFNEESRVLLVNFNGIDRVSPGDKRAFAEMLQRDDITVVAEGLLEGMNPKLLSLDYMAVAVKDHVRVRRYKRDTSGDYVTYEEKKGHLSMKLSDFLIYLEQRKKSLNPDHSGKTETVFSFTDRELKKVNVDVTDPLYLIDMDMPNRLPYLHQELKKALKMPEILPGGEWCMMHQVLCSTLVALVLCGPEVFLTFLFCPHFLGT
jgi:hypothetical protein